MIITPAVYLRYIHTLRDNYVEQSGHIEERKNRLEKLLQKLEAISVQVFLEKLRTKLSFYLFSSHTHFIITTWKLTAGVVARGGVQVGIQGAFRGVAIQEHLSLTIQVFVS